MKFFFRPHKFACLVNRRSFASFNPPRSNYKKLHISTDLLHVFHPQIEHLRKTSAPKNDLARVDYIDEKCSHFVLHHNLMIVGSVRISSSQNSILNYWYNQQFPYPTGTDVAELTKAVVLPKYQNNGLYKLMMLEVLLRLPELGYSRAIASVRPGLPQRPFLRDLGFTEHNEVMVIKDQNASFEAIPIYLKYIDKNLVKEKYFSHVDLLNKKNITVGKLQSDVVGFYPHPSPGPTPC